MSLAAALAANGGDPSQLIGIAAAAAFQGGNQAFLSMMAEQHRSSARSEQMAARLHSAGVPAFAEQLPENTAPMGAAFTASVPTEAASLPATELAQVTDIGIG